MIFPGDLEREGWVALLRKPEFHNELRRVNVFVASYDGRDDGYCKEVFDFCKPRVIIVSDGGIKYTAQKPPYRQRTYELQCGVIRYAPRIRYVDWPMVSARIGIHCA